MKVNVIVCPNISKRVLLPDACSCQSVESWSFRNSIYENRRETVFQNARPFHGTFDAQLAAETMSVGFVRCLVYQQRLLVRHSIYRAVISTHGEYSEQQPWTSLIAQREPNVT